MLNRNLILALCCCVLSGLVRAEDAAPAPTTAQPRSTIGALMERASSYLGIRYRLGGDGPTDGGFDCSGLVRKVFGDAMGLNLPRTAQEMAGVGDTVRNKEELKPGDLVFFKTMRRTFSHVGIYLGDNRFVHAPSAGGRVRVDDMRDSYWVKAFKGARRLIPEASAATLPGPMVMQPVPLAASEPAALPR